VAQSFSQSMRKLLHQPEHPLIYNIGLPAHFLITTKHETSDIVMLMIIDV
jgi:hypothetical protein